MRFRRLCNLSVNVFVQLTLLGNEEKIEKKGTEFNGPIQVCFECCPPPFVPKLIPGGEDCFSQPYDLYEFPGNTHGSKVLVNEDKPLVIDIYFGGARSKGFALLRNTSKLHSDFPKLLRN